MHRILKSGSMWTKVDPDLGCQVSYDKGETWETLDLSDVEHREFRIEQPRVFFPARKECKINE